MKRGIVMSVHDHYAVVMTADGQFLRAPLQGSPQIGEELVFEEEARVKRRTGISRTAYRYAAAAAMFCLLTIGGIAYSIQNANPVVAYVTMDINPSVEIGVDGKERVRALRALNEDGAEIIADIDYKGKDVELVAAAILDHANQSHYLDAPHKDILITSMILNGKKEFAVEFESMLTGKLNEKLQEWLTEHTSDVNDVTIMTLSVPAELRNEADAYGISTGKMAVYLMAKDEGYEGELSELKEVSIDTWTEPIGGVEKIVAAEDDAATKAKLQELLAKEKKEKEEIEKKPTARPGAGKKDNATAKPTASPSAVPTVKPSSKPTTPADSKGKNGKQNRGNDEKDSNKDWGSFFENWKNDEDQNAGNQGQERDDDQNNNWMNGRYTWNERNDDDRDRDRDKDRDRDRDRDRDQDKDRDDDKDQNDDNDRNNDNDRNDDNDRGNDKARNNDNDRDKDNDKRNNDSDRGRDGRGGLDRD